MKVVLAKSILTAAALLVSSASAFAPHSLRSSASSSALRQSTSLLSSQTGVDVSIPYDAAAKLAYDEWCQQYGKTPDSKRYEIFKSNYETITVANVVAKKQARDTDASPPALLTLNEYGDCTAEEYQAAMNAPKQTSTGDVLGKALEAAQSQEQASSALEDAANALAQEEEVSGSCLIAGDCFAFDVSMLCAHRSVRTRSYRPCLLR